MDYERISTYLRSLEPQDNEIISDIETYATAGNFPIAKRETMSFLQTMIKVKKPARILEVGTCIAYSTLIMAITAPEAKITTIEIGDADFEIAKANVAKAEEAGLITKGAINLIKGDATDVLPRLRDELKTARETSAENNIDATNNIEAAKKADAASNTGAPGFDFVFMDAAKGQYITWLNDVLSLMNEGGILISDNVFQDENIFESRYAVERRDRTIHKRMREYLYEIKNNDALETSILPLGDGVALSVKLENKWVTKK